MFLFFILFINFHLNMNTYNFRYQRSKKWISKIQKSWESGYSKSFLCAQHSFKNVVTLKNPLSTTDYSMYYYFFKDFALLEIFCTSSRHKGGLNSPCEWIAGIVWEYQIKSPVQCRIPVLKYSNPNCASREFRAQVMGQFKICRVKRNVLERIHG